MLPNQTTNKPRFSKSWFNPLYFHLLEYIDNPKIRKVMIYGGKGSAKTFTINQFFAIYCYLHKYSIIAYRKEQTSIKTTLKESIKKAIQSTRMDAVWETFDFSFKNSTNNTIILKGLDTEGKVKGVEGFKYLMFDELDHFEQQEWNQANLSLRGMPNQKLIGTWNPVDENIWIKKELDSHKWIELPLIIGENEHSRLDKNSFVRISEDNSTLLIKTTYLDNKWIVGADGYGYRDENLIREYERTKEIDENSYRVNVLGEWGIADKESKYAWAFDTKKHVEKGITQSLIDKFGKPFDPNYVVWCSFDFNINPMTCSIIQHYADKRQVRVLRTIRMENTLTIDVCRRILELYPNAMFKVTGDASGNNRSTIAMSNDLNNNYKIIHNTMRLLPQSLVVPTRNPDIQHNKQVLNAFLNYYDVKLDEELCQPLIYDLMYVEINEKNEIIKDRTSSKKYADFLDNFRYFVNVEFQNVSIFQE